VGFLVAALLLSVSLGRTEAWSGAKKALMWIANLSWISVLLLAASLVPAKARWRPPTSARAEVLAARGVWIGRMGQSAHCGFVLLVGVRGRLASDQALPEKR
jgi:hypothetical protein